MTSLIICILEMNFGSFTMGESISWKVGCKGSDSICIYMKWQNMERNIFGWGMNRVILLINFYKRQFGMVKIFGMQRKIWNGWMIKYPLI